MKRCKEVFVAESKLLFQNSRAKKKKKLAINKGEKEIKNRRP